MLFMFSCAPMMHGCGDKVKSSNAVQIFYEDCVRFDSVFAEGSYLLNEYSH